MTELMRAAVIAIAAMLAMAAAVELLARVWIRHHRVYYVWPPGVRRRVGPDRQTHPQLEPVCRFEVNRDGERGSGFPRNAVGVYRILVTGGSAVECYLNDQPTAWPGKLETLLNEPERKRALGATAVHVGTVGKSAVDARALAMILRRILPRYRRLDAIVIMVGASDVLRWIEDGAPADRPASPVPVSSCFVEHPEVEFGLRPGSLAVVELLRRLRQRLRRGVEVSEGVARWLGRARTMRAQAGDFRTAIPDSTAMLANFEMQFRECLVLASGAVRRVIVARQPWFQKTPYTPDEEALLWSGGVGSAFKGDVSAYYTHDVLFELMRRMDARASAIARESGVEQIDFMPLLEMSAATFYDHFHLTPAGAEAVARRVAEQFVRTPH